MPQETHTRAPTVDHFGYCLEQADTHYKGSKHDTDDGRDGPPASGAEPDVAQRRKNVRESTSTRCPDELKDSTQVAGYQR